MRVKVKGMTCGHCERAVKEAIETHGGTGVVDLAAGTVDIVGITDPAVIRDAIEAAGYEVVGNAYQAEPVE
ncbi:heavy-metal-associated domain-containing protein [Luteimonas mephitis]|uniref:heavy-metal-associated domain-containing protein n=1 Tax=Luteimonas mephitis TaxID=83615 RepID=UPI00040F6E89|nr:heavy metal-associated domain-containing protein [Luteimonas mephitis]